MSIGQILRHKREELGMTQDEVAARAGISKPYLSSIETGRAPNPPGEDKLRRLELALRFAEGQLLRLARMERAPTEIRDEIERLRAENRRFRALLGGATNLDELYRTGRLAEIVSQLSGPSTDAPPPAEQSGPSAGDALSADQPGQARLQQFDAGLLVPVINRVAAGYPMWYGDLDYPPGVADDYVRCPGCHDPHAFAARVSGDSMEPKYHEGDIVTFSPAEPVTDGDDCFVRLAETHETNFKRVFTESDGRIRLQPRNEKYSPQFFDREQVDGLYKAILRVEKL